MTFWKKQNSSDSKMISCLQGLERRLRWTVGVQRIFKTMKLFCLKYNGGYMSLYTCQKPSQCIISRVNTNELWVTMKHQCKSTNCNKYITAVWESAVVRMCILGRGVWESSELSAQFCSKLKTALRKLKFIKSIN